MADLAIFIIWIKESRLRANLFKCLSNQPYLKSIPEGIAGQPGYQVASGLLQNERPCVRAWTIIKVFWSGISPFKRHNSSSGWITISLSHWRKSRLVLGWRTRSLLFKRSRSAWYLCLSFQTGSWQARGCRMETELHCVGKVQLFRHKRCTYMMFQNIRKLRLWAGLHFLVEMKQPCKWKVGPS